MARAMASSLSNLVHILTEIIHKTKWKYGHDNEKCEAWRAEYKDFECSLEYKNVKDDLIQY